MKFEKGEVAIYFCIGDKDHLADCEVAGNLEIAGWVNHATGERGVGLGYDVYMNGKEYFALQNELRKKKPPKKIDWVKMCKLNQIGEIA
jgi:hypothetical protein